MASLRELRRKVKSVKNTQKITKAMKLVAASRLNKAQERILSARPFAEKLQNLLHELAFLLNQKGGEGYKDHPFFLKPESSRIDLLVVTADRGLCGGFNANLIRQSLKFIQEHPENDIHLWVIGKKGRDTLRRVNLNIEREYINFFQKLGFHQAELVGKELIESFLKGKTREILVLYNEFKSRIQQKLVLKKLLPIDPIAGVEPKLDFIYEPSKEVICEGLLPRTIKAQIYRILLESQAAELAARMTAMESATNNAQDVIYSLTLTMNKVRQATITKEIAEIVGGAEALQA